MMERFRDFDYTKYYKDIGDLWNTPLTHLKYFLTHYVQVRPQNPSRPPRIGIVGAGVAGLRCADILLHHGFQVIILEARDRIGGRIHHFKLPSGQVVDLGPNWVHGTESNPILELAKETDTQLHSVSIPRMTSLGYYSTRDLEEHAVNFRCS
jgi:monoamine oxidase